LTGFSSLPPSDYTVKNVNRMCCYSLKIFLKYFLISEAWMLTMMNIEVFNADTKEKASYLYHRKKESNKKAK